MADEPDDLTLRLLRDIRTKLEDLDVLKERFDRMDARFDELHETIYIATGFATHANVRSESTEKRLAKVEARLAKLEEKA